MPILGACLERDTLRSTARANSSSRISYMILWNHVTFLPAASSTAVAKNCCAAGDWNRFFASYSECRMMLRCTFHASPSPSRFLYVNTRKYPSLRKKDGATTKISGAATQVTLCMAEQYVLIMKPSVSGFAEFRSN